MNPSTGSNKKAKKAGRHPHDFYRLLGLIRKMTMKLRLNLFFIVMDVLTLLAYPIVFVHGKLRRFSKPKEDIALTNLVAVDSAVWDR
jgi:hypothetical protein